MSYIITELCLSTCDSALVEICPVDCINGPEDTEDYGLGTKEEGFNPEGKMLYINSDECIDCEACEPECPVEAIYEQGAVPDEWIEFIKINYDFFGPDYKKANLIF